MRARLHKVAFVCATAIATVAVGGGAARGATPTAETPVAGGTLNVVAEQQVNGFNVYDACCNEQWAFWEEAPVLLSAFVQEPDGSYQPQLVTSVDVSTSPSFTLTYHINPNAVWSDGLPVSADDFRFTWLEITESENIDANPNGYDQIESMTELDSKTVRAVFIAPYADWRSLFSPVLPQQAFTTREDFDTIWRNGIDDTHTGKPIGDGPFLMTGYDASSQITLTRNPRWWGAHAAYLNSIVFHVVTDTDTEESEMANGQVQAIFPTIGTYLSPLLSARGVANQSVLAPYYELLLFNVAGSQRGPLEDQAWVRQAIADSIDRTAIANAAYSPVASVPVSQSAFYYPGEAGYAATFAAYSYEPSQVAALMTNHGCTLGGDGIWICSGTRMSFVVEYAANEAIRQQEASMMQAEARAAGIELIPYPESFSDLFGTNGIPGGDFQIGLVAFSSSGDPSDWSSFYRCGYSANWSGYCNTAVDDAISTVDSDPNASQRIADANTVDQLLAADVPTLPLHSRPQFAFYSTRIRGLVDNGNVDGPLWNAQDVWMAPNVAAPSVTSFTPTHGTGGTSVTITGSGFTGATAVRFGGAAASSFTVNTDTQITATVAPGTQTSVVTVTGPGGTGTSSGLFYTPPTVGGFAPSSAAQHSTVAVSGTSLRGATSVKLNGTSVPFTVVSNTSITFTVPTGATTGTIQVTAPGGSATSTGTLSLTPPPTITSFTPENGSVGTTITITGTNLDHVVAVEIGHVLTVPTSATSTQVVFTIPPGAVGGPIKVIGTNGSATSVDTLTITG